jgi:hypothetical protein
MQPNEPPLLLTTSGPPPKWSSEELLKWSQRFLQSEPDNFFAHVLMVDQLDIGESPKEVMDHLGETLLNFDQ